MGGEQPQLFERRWKSSDTVAIKAELGQRYAVADLWGDGIDIIVAYIEDY